MSREIKFRAYQSHHSLHRKPGMYLVESLEFYDDPEHGNGEAFLHVEGESAKSSEYFSDIHLMQYTGLKGENGIEVYEGDVFWFDPDENDTVLIVAFKNQMRGRGESVAQFAFEVHGNSHYIGEGGQDCFGPFQHIDDMHLDEFELSEMAVIGNIYQNRELLAGQSESTS